MVCEEKRYVEVLLDRNDGQSTYRKLYTYEDRLDCPLRPGERVIVPVYSGTAYHKLYTYGMVVRAGQPLAYEGTIKEVICRELNSEVQNTLSRETASETMLRTTMEHTIRAAVAHEVRCQLQDALENLRKGLPAIVRTVMSERSVTHAKAVLRRNGEAG